MPVVFSVGVLGVHNSIFIFNVAEGLELHGVIEGGCRYRPAVAASHAESRVRTNFVHSWKGFGHFIWRNCLEIVFSYQLLRPGAFQKTLQAMRCTPAGSFFCCLSPQFSPRVVVLPVRFRIVYKLLIRNRKKLGVWAISYLFLRLNFSQKIMAQRTTITRTIPGANM